MPRVPLLAGALTVLMSALALLAYALGGVASAGAPWTESAAVRLTPVDQPLHPLLLLASVVTLAFAALVAAPRHRLTVPVAGGAVALAALATLGLYPVPLWLVLGVLAAIAVGLLALALRRTDDLGSLLGALAAGTGAVVVLAALPSVVLTTVALSLLVIGLATTLARGRFPLAAEAAGLLLPLALGGLVWSLCELAGVDPALRAVPTFAVLGLLALVLARPEVEVAAATASFFAAVAAVPNAADVSVSLAIHLTDRRRDRHDERDPPAVPPPAGLARRCAARDRDVGAALTTSASSTRSPTRCPRRSPSSWSGSTASARATTPRPPRRSARASRWPPSRRCSGSWPTR